MEHSVFWEAYSCWDNRDIPHHLSHGPCSEAVEFHILPPCIYLILSYSYYINIFIVTLMYSQNNNVIFSIIILSMLLSSKCSLPVSFFCQNFIPWHLSRFHPYHIPRPSRSSCRGKTLPASHSVTDRSACRLVRWTVTHTLMVTSVGLYTSTWERTKSFANYIINISR